MTNIGKVLVVVTLAASLGWLGFVMAVVAGGPNWRGMAESNPELRDYEFSRTEGENSQWQAKLRGSAQTVATDASLAKVVLQVERDVQNRQNQILNGNPATNTPALQQQIDQLQQSLEQARKFAAVDAQALTTAETQLTQNLTEINRQIAATTQEIAKLADQTAATQAEVTARRGDVYRLRQQLQELETDRDRLIGLQPRLRDRIVQGKADVAALQRRQAQGDK